MPLRTADPDQDPDHISPSHYDDPSFNDITKNFRNEHSQSADEEGTKNGKPGVKKYDEEDLRDKEQEQALQSDTEEARALAAAVPEAAQPAEKDLFNDKAKKKPKSRFGGRKSAFVAVGSAGLVMSLILGLFMFLTIYRTEHIRTLLWDYRFARFHAQVAKRVKANLDAQIAGDFTSGEGSKLKLSEKISGGTPESRRAGGQLLDRGNLTEIGFDPSVRSRLRDKFGINFGERIKSYTDKLRGKTGNEDRAPTDEERRSTAIEEDIQRAKGGSTDRPTGSLEDADKLAEEDLKNGIGEPQASDLLEKPAGAPVVREGEVVKRFNSGGAKFAQKLGNVSSVAAIMTFGCIFNDLSSSLDGVLRQRIDGPMRGAAQFFGETEQLKSGTNVDTNLLQTREEQTSAAESTRAIQKAGDPSKSEEDLKDAVTFEVADLPGKFFGIKLRTIADINSTFQNVLDGATYALLFPIAGFASLFSKDGFNAGSLRSEICKYILNPAVQTALLGVDIVALFASFGTAQSTGKILLETLKAAVSIGASVEINKLIFGYVIPKAVFSLAGSNSVLVNADIQSGNKLDYGAMALSNQAAKYRGASPISILQASRDQETAIALVKKQRLRDEGFFAYINPKSPYSILGQMSLKLPGKPSKVPAALLKMSVLNLGSLVTKNPFFGGKASAAAAYNLDTYDMPQYGLPDTLINIKAVDNAAVVEAGGQLEANIAKYANCSNSAISDDLLGEKNDVQGDVDCNSEMAQRTGLYVIDGCTAIHLNPDLTEVCSPLPGAGDVTTVPPASEGGFGDTGEDDGTPGVPAECINAVVGVDKTVRVQGIAVQTCLASKLEGLLNDAKSAGISISGWGWRSIETQKQLRVTNGCPDINISPASSCRVPTARPGRSMHEKGLAVDFTYKGSTLNGSGQAFTWMKANAGKYGFYNLPSEAWHWSVNAR